MKKFNLIQSILVIMFLIVLFLVSTLKIVDATYKNELGEEVRHLNTSHSMVLNCLYIFNESSCESYRPFGSKNSNSYMIRKEKFSLISTILGRKDIDKETTYFCYNEEKERVIIQNEIETIAFSKEYEKIFWG